MDRTVSQQRISLGQYIEIKYDVETARLVILRRHHGVLQKLARYKNHLIFNIRCSQSLRLSCDDTSVVDGQHRFHVVVGTSMLQ